MNWKKIVIFSILITAVGVTYGFLLVFFGLDMPASYNSNKMWFIVYFIVPLPVYSGVYFALSKGLENSHYKNAIAVALLSSIYGYSALYLLFGELMLSIADVIGVCVTLAAIFIGTVLGIKVRRSGKNA